MMGLCIFVNSINQTNFKIMNKLTYLFSAFALVMFTACGGGPTQQAVTEEAAEGIIEKAGCQAEGGKCLADHSCCFVKEEDTEGSEEGNNNE